MKCSINESSMFRNCKDIMKKNKIVKNLLLVSLLGIQPSGIQADSILRESNDHLGLATPITFALISVIFFKQFGNVRNQYDMLCRSVLPNFDQIMTQMEPELRRCTDSKFSKIWNNFLETHIRPAKPELIPELKKLDFKSGLLFGAGFIAATISFCLFCDYLQKKLTQKYRPSNNLQN